MKDLNLIKELRGIAFELQVTSALIKESNQRIEVLKANPDYQSEMRIQENLNLIEFCNNENEKFNSRRNELITLLSL
jgi:hypothetical protein